MWWGGSRRTKRREEQTTIKKACERGDFATAHRLIVGMGINEEEDGVYFICTYLLERCTHRVTCSRRFVPLKNDSTSVFPKSTSKHESCCKNEAEAASAMGISATTTSSSSDEAVSHIPNPPCESSWLLAAILKRFYGYSKVSLQREDMQSFFGTALEGFSWCLHCLLSLMPPYITRPVPQGVTEKLACVALYLTENGDSTTAEQIIHWTMEHSTYSHSIELKLLSLGDLSCHRFYYDYKISHDSQYYITNGYLDSTLASAVESGDVKVVLRVLEWMGNRSITEIDPNGKSFNTACKCTTIDCLQLIFSSGARKDSEGARNGYYWIFSGQVRDPDLARNMIDLIIKNGLDISDRICQSTCNQELVSPLAAALTAKSSVIVNLLLEHQISIGPEHFIILMKQSELEHVELLHKSLGYIHREAFPAAIVFGAKDSIIEYLIKSGMDLNTKVPTPFCAPSYPLELALRFNRPHICHFLLDHGVRIPSPSNSDEDWFLPVFEKWLNFLANTPDTITLFERVLKLRPDTINAEYTRLPGGLLLHSVKSGHIPTMQVLLKNGANKRTEALLCTITDCVKTCSLLSSGVGCIHCECADVLVKNGALLQMAHFETQKGLNPAMRNKLISLVGYESCRCFALVTQKRCGHLSIWNALPSYLLVEVLSFVLGIRRQ